MEIIKPTFIIETEINPEHILHGIEWTARTCYKSHDKITRDSSEKLVSSLIKRGHEAMLEHESITVRFICDRGVSHELVRHRLASFAQESTRYCNYSKDKFNNELTFIEPNTAFNYDLHTNNTDTLKYLTWLNCMREIEKKYLYMIYELGAAPEEARSILPNSLKTEIVVTANLREWRKILQLRTAKDAHPQMREIMLPLLQELKQKLPIIFDDIGGTDVNE